LDPSKNFTVAFDAFTPGLTPDDTIFLTITNASTGAFVFSTESGVVTTTEFTVPGGKLAAGVSYVADWDFTNRELATSPQCEGSDPSQCPSIGEVGFD
jgi:hypothetical protein